MTTAQKLHIAESLLNTRGLVGDGMYLPKAFVVNGKPYWFMNAAKRAAYSTNHPIEVMTIEQAWEIHTNLPADTLKKSCIAKDFDQTGTTYDGKLFDDRESVYADSINIRIIKTTTQL